MSTTTLTLSQDFIELYAWLPLFAFGIYIVFKLLSHFKW